MEEALDLEEQHIEEGRQEGLRDGRRLGAQEGRALGLNTGFEIGHELGYYSGCVQAWRQLQADHPTFATARADKAIGALEEQLRNFPRNDPKNEGLQELMDGVRGKFKAVAAMLGLGEAYSQQGNPEPRLQF